MVLNPLEFSECYLDSPLFRENIQKYEEELERTNGQIKQLIKDARNMLNAFYNHEKMIKIFSASLQKFQFDCIGGNFTDNEKGIAGSLNEFGVMLQEVAEEWSHTIDRLEIQLVPPLESFRKEQICSYRESKKLFEKASERYYKHLENTLGLSHKRKEQQLQEADTELMNLKKSFHQEALKYVDKLQEVEERKKFEFVEHLLMFMQVYFNYFHQTHETASDCKHYMSMLQPRGTKKGVKLRITIASPESLSEVQLYLLTACIMYCQMLNRAQEEQLISTRTQFDGTREKTGRLMKKMTDNPNSVEYVMQAFGGSWSTAGYLLLMEKNAMTVRLTSKWTKYFCMYKKGSRVFRMVPTPHATFNSVGAMGAKVGISSNPNNAFTEMMTVKSCIRRKSDSLDRRFCFDLELEDISGKILTATFQAVSAEERKKWLAAMDGKEPEYITTTVVTNKEDLCKLDHIGLQFVKDIIKEIEKRGLDNEGMYRLVGITSKVDLLLQNALTPKSAPSVNYANEDEWETNTLTSALKGYFRNLPEPIMTFDLHRNFIDAAKCNNPEDRVKKVAALIKKLPEENKKALRILAEHLWKVQDHSEQNKMTLQNLGVCFGPTLLRDRHETVQAILEIKFSNIIVEILVEERHLMLGVGPQQGSQVKNLLSLKNSGRTSSISKLPSQKFKERPVGMVYTVTSLANILEGEQAKKAPDNTFKQSKFNRFKAFRDKPKHNLPQQNSQERVSSSSEEVDDAYEEIVVGKPLKPPIEPLKPPSLTQNMGFNLIDGSRRGDPQNGSVKTAPKAPVKQPSLYTRPMKPKLRRDKSVDDTESGKPVPKKRVPQNLRRTRQTSLGDQEACLPNSNNSNIRPALPQKPKTLISGTMKLGKRKLLGSRNEKKGSPRLPGKDFLSPDEGASKPVQRSKSTGSDITPKRRPKSEFIPAAFLVEESRQHNANPHAKSCKENYNHLASKPASPSAFDDGGSTSYDDSFSESDFSDDEIRSTVARTLYECSGEDENELSFQPGQLIHNITKSDEPGWLRGKLNGKIGLLPRNHVQFL